MTKLQRVKEIIWGLMMILAALIMLIVPKEGYDFVIAILSLVYTVKGINTIIYYFTMARFMVGGKNSLYMGIILLDFGILTGTLTDVPHYYVLLYLITLHAFSGVVEILRSLEAKRYGARSWKLKMGHGMLNFAMSAVCIIFMKQMPVAVIVYATALLYSAVLRIISACRRTKLVYIQ
ncbi:MAG: hypothetical protein K6E75_06915 [Lachnospiraceae bacterium]|nr:hypothetical protein [Lachnospiraceae bacterium]